MLKILLFFQNQKKMIAIMVEEIQTVVSKGTEFEQHDELNEHLFADNFILSGIRSKKRNARHGY